MSHSGRDGAAGVTPGESLEQPAELSLRSTPGLFALLRLTKLNHRAALRVALQTRSVAAVGRRFGGEETWQHKLTEAAHQIESFRRGGIETLGFFDSHYPPLLRTLDDPPAVIWIKGGVQALSRHCAAVVGTREPTEFGLETATAVAQEAVSRSWCVVSGLAKGIDTAAHRAALDHSGATVAVLAGGLDRIYPAENRELAEEILECGGALISEQPPGTRPPRWAFVDRDRLQSGLSRAVFVCQTGRAGGTMHTVRFGIKQGKPIYCPYPVDSDSKSEGLRLLLERPGKELATAIREWATDKTLRGHLVDQPVAHPFTGDRGLTATFNILERLDDSRTVENDRDSLPPPDRATVDQLSLLESVP